MGNFNDAATKAAALLLTSSLLAAGCSSSSDSPVLFLEPVTQTSDSNLPETSANELNSDTVTDVVPDPLVQSRTQVDFWITVPAYQSDKLQVQLTWGDTDVSAGWVGDELWSVSVDLPNATENLLTITFYDNNGSLVLGTFETPYRTNTQLTENYFVTADQFDSERWDNDGDGSSNLDELLAGTDPELDASLLLEVRDTVLLSSNIFITEYFSRKLPSERPYSLSYSETPTISDDGPPWGGPTLNGAIAVDINGTGTFYDFYQYRPLDTSIQSATRSRIGTTTVWEGDWNDEEAWDVDSRRTLRSFRNEITNVDESTRSYTGEVSWEYRISAAYSTSSTYQYDIDLIGTRVNESSLCIPVEGSIVSTYRYSSNDPNVVTRSSRTTISKTSSDQYWKVKTVDTESENVTSEYYARSLESSFGQNGGQFALIYPSGPELQGKFKCEFVDNTGQSN